MAKQQILALTRGDDRAIEFDLRDSSTAGWAATFTIRQRVDGPKPLLVSHSTVDIDGTVIFLLPHSDTAVLPTGRLVGDLQLTSPDGTISTMTPDGNTAFDPILIITVYGDVTLLADSIEEASNGDF